METSLAPELAAALASPFFTKSPDGIVVVNTSGEIVAINPQATELLGYGLSELVGTTVDRLVPESLRPTHESHRKSYTDQPHTRSMGAGLRLFALHKKGQQIPVDIALSPLVADGTYYTIAAIRDATARVEAEIAISEADEWRAIIDDRQRIARDLHDTVIQDIFAAGMGLQALQRGMVEDSMKAQLGSSVSHLDSVITRLRKVIFNLTHGDESESLEKAANRVVREVVNDNAIDVSIRVTPDGAPLPARTQEHLLATLQEAVSNVIRHAEATNLHVRIDTTQGTCRLCVSDDGIGMPDAAATRPGFGLTNMMNRAQVLGGGCDITEPDAGGTMVEWTVPL
ncbi:MAG: PAS domain-containing sensor histidine kinase [Acidimicrobiia bacterium]|nr:PAS domain-containing sensor histidine kinase [Acidimicrobiia bacterium]